MLHVSAEGIDPRRCGLSSVVCFRFCTAQTRKTCNEDIIIVMSDDEDDVPYVIFTDSYVG